MRQKIKLVGGKIDIAGRPGYGTTILAWVPLREDRSEPTTRAAVDDHRVVSEGLKHLLSEDFELVGMVEDGRALVAAAKLQPDVIVADITMPHLNGIEAMAQLKKDNPTSRLSS